ncbi:MAG: TonB-dependent receptor, partial [Rubrivivax sp.]|nr:TonB-dependent receptor [Rubrivivax sp.]
MIPIRVRTAALRGLVLCCPLFVFAQPLAATVVVTAARTPQPLSEVLADMRVIDREAIARAGTMSLAELLQLHGGAEISANGGPGQVSGVFLRGANANHVVLLIDGVRVNSATAGTSAFEHIALEQIERIEVMRAPASGLYGADAVGGVIQIFTRQGVDGFSARLGAGSWQTRQGSARWGASSGGTQVSVQGGYRDSQAFSATNASNAFSFNADTDPYRQVHGGLNISHAFSADHALALRLTRNQGTTHFDSGPGSDDLSRQRLSTLALESRNRLGAGWHSQLRLARGSDDMVFEGSFPSRFRTDQQQFSWQNDIDAAGGRIVAGAEWRQEQVSGSTAYSRNERSVRSLFGGYSVNLGAQGLQASLRHDDNDQFGASRTGRLAYGWQASPAWRLSASVGTAFKAPSFNDLYYPLTWGFAGNPDLRPERARAHEL